ncbi:MAG: Ku protein [Phycisphaerales bacterium]|jgi:DNA end-binding protein Ku|nr:Ku protein [Phycisphaerales bacterium]
MASRSIWTGSITFGLVNIPVKLFVAVREKNIQFHMLHDQDHVRLQRKMICPADGKEVHSEHVVKGYELSPGQYVVVREAELEAAAPKKSKTIEIEDFVDLGQIDPVYFDRPYYVVPQEQGVKAYRLLVESMEKSKKVGVARFVMRNKEYLCALRPQEGALVLETMHFNDEVIPVDQVDGVPHKAKSDERELKMASQLIESLSTKFKPEKYHDTYREAVQEIIEKKAEGEKIVTPPDVEVKKKGGATNLMAALEASLAKAKGSARAPAAAHTAARTTRRRRSA